MRPAGQAGVISSRTVVPKIKSAGSIHPRLKGPGCLDNQSVRFPPEDVPLGVPVRLVIHSRWYPKTVPGRRWHRQDDALPVPTILKAFISWVGVLLPHVQALLLLLKKD